MSARAQAAATMCAEMEHQVADLRTALQGSAEMLRSIAGELSRAAALVSIGIGDSGLVGRLAADLPAGRSREFHAISPDSLDAGQLPARSIVLCQSISGSTGVTMAAARLLQNSGIRTVAVVGEPDSPLGRLADREVLLPIPRYPPDAKVPGTITVSIPLAATVCLLEMSRGVPLDVAMEEFAISWERGLARAASMIGAGEWCVPQSVHILGGASSTAAYLQAKLAETLGISASIARAEEWLHVGKHAAAEGVCVIALACRSQPQLNPAVRLETLARGASFFDVLDPAGANGAPSSVLCRVAAPAPPATPDLLLDVAFAQHLCLRLLQAPGIWAPFQLHRLDKETVRGLCRREWSLESEERPMVSS